MEIVDNFKDVARGADASAPLRDLNHLSNQTSTAPLTTVKNVDSSIAVVTTPGFI